MVRKTWASESVTGAHPDKLADLISDTVLDYVLEQDPNGRVACETFIPGDLAQHIFVGGEVTGNINYKDYSDILNRIKNVIKEIGYTKEVSPGFNNQNCRIKWLVKQQSPDISQGVDIGGSGDQGLMIGYASNETPELMPMPIYLAHKLTKRLAGARKSGELPFLRPDGKSQVSVIYENGKPVEVSHITIAAQHSEDVSDKDLHEGILDEVVKLSIPQYLIKRNLFDITTINGTGRFVVGGPVGDSGLTGRKIVVDTYGGIAPNGGGALSGKDATKVDRSATYMARYIAKNIVAAELADKCQVHLAYEIGKAEPVAVDVETFGTSEINDENLVEIIRKEFTLTPKGIIDYLNLRRPIYTKTTNYGHFGRNDPDFTWEKTDKADKLKEYLPKERKFFPHEFSD
ncbi:methionine adenosyltransferase [Candidatus Woesearchaeota archaeon]|nr:methionine adenosyltransferase [Candidatus Woesearchaeota archaeon]